MNKAVFLGCVAVSLICTGNASGKSSTYTYFPFSPIALGLGVDPSQPNEKKSQCLDFETEALDTGSRESGTTLYVATSKQQVDRALDIDSNIEASFLDNRAEAKLTYSTSSLYDSDNIMIIVKSYSEAPHLQTKNVVVSKGMKTNFLAPKNFSGFAAACGTEVVDIVWRRNTVAVLITVSGLSKQEIDELGGSASVDAGVGGFGGKVSTKINSLLKEKSASGAINVQVVASGGRGLEAQGQLVSQIESGLNLEKIMQALGSYLSGFTNDTAVVVRAQTVPMSNYVPELSDLEIWDSTRRDTIREIARAYKDLRAAIRLTDACINVVKDAKGWSLIEAKFQAYQENKSKYEQYLTALEKAHSDCRTVDKPCTVPHTDLPSPVPPWVPKTANSYVASGGSRLLSPVGVKAGSLVLLTPQRLTWIEEGVNTKDWNLVQTIQYKLRPSSKGISECGVRADEWVDRKTWWLKLRSQGHDVTAPDQIQQNFKKISDGLHLHFQWLDESYNQKAVACSVTGFERAKNIGNQVLFRVENRPTCKIYDDHRLDDPTISVVNDIKWDQQSYNKVRHRRYYWNKGPGKGKEVDRNCWTNMEAVEKKVPVTYTPKVNYGGEFTIFGLE